MVAQARIFVRGVRAGPAALPRSVREVSRRARGGANRRVVSGAGGVTAGADSAAAGISTAALRVSAGGMRSGLKRVAERVVLAGGGRAGGAARRRPRPRARPVVLFSNILGPGGNGRGVILAPPRPRRVSPRLLD